MSSLKQTSLTKAIFLMGPTASGKTELAILLRQKLPVEVINVDSALIYRGMNIGTAKPSLNELALAPHRLLDIRDPAETYSVAEFCHDAIVEMADIKKKGKIPLLVGGTMFYFKSLLEGLSPLPSANPTIRQYIEQIAMEKSWKTLHSQLCKIDPATGNRIHPNDLQRILRALEIFFITGKSVTELIQKSNGILPYNIYQFAISPLSREILHQRIILRYNKMLELGFESEVQVLFERGDLHINMPSVRCVGYRQMWSYLSGNINYNNMIYQGINATKQLAKRQMTWLRSWQNLHWLDSDNVKLASDKVLQVINTN